MFALGQELENHRLSDAVVKTIESDADRSCPPEDAVTDEIRQKESPTKRRKIEHEMSPIFKVLACVLVLSFVSLTCSCHILANFVQYFPLVFIREPRQPNAQVHSSDKLLHWVGESCRNLNPCHTGSTFACGGLVTLTWFRLL